MKITYCIATCVEGTLSELDDAPAPKDPPSLEEVLASMAELAFMVETVAHLQGREQAMLPTAQKARALIARLTVE